MAQPASEAKVTAAVSLPADVVHVLQKQKRIQRITNEKFFRCHPELREMVSSFMSELLKHKPEDPILFAENYFTQPDLARQLGYEGWTRPPTPQVDDDEEARALALESGYGLDDDEGEEEMAGTTELDVVDLEKMLISLFKEADQDGSGELDFEEFRQLMETADLNLSPQEVKMLLSEIDESADGLVSYSEFVGIAVEVIQTMRLKQRYEDIKGAEEPYLREAAQQIIGMTPAAVEELVMKSAGGAGLLSRQQVKTLLRSPLLGMSKQQINQAATNVDYDGDGMVAAATLAPTLYTIMEGVVVHALAMQNLGEVGQELTRLCEFYDKDDCGFLDVRVLKQAILQGFQYVTRLQVNALLSDSDVPTDAEGKVAWREYLPKLTAILKGMGDPEAIREREALTLRADFQPQELMSGKDHEQMRALLEGLFKQYDADGSGELDASEFTKCMVEANLGLTELDAEDLMQAFDLDGDGKISCAEFIELAYEVLVNLARERQIMSSMAVIEPEVLY